MSDDWDPDKVAAECKAAAADKVKRVARRKRRGSAPAPPVVSEDKPTDPPMEGRDEKGRFAEGTSLGVETRLHGSETLYDPEVHPEQARKLAQLGATQYEIAQFFEVVEATLYNWRNRHPEFAEALRVGKDPADNRTERSYYELANGYRYIEEQAIRLRDADGNERVEIVKVERMQPPDGTAAIKWLCNRRPNEWRERREVNIGGTLFHAPASVSEARKDLAAFFTEYAIALPASDTARDDDESLDF